MRTCKTKTKTRNKTKLNLAYAAFAMSTFAQNMRVSFSYAKVAHVSTP